MWYSQQGIQASLSTMVLHHDSVPNPLVGQQRLADWWLKTGSWSWGDRRVTSLHSAWHLLKSSLAGAPVDWTPSRRSRWRPVWLIGGGISGGFLAQSKREVSRHVIEEEEEHVVENSRAKRIPAHQKQDSCQAAFGVLENKGMKGPPKPLERPRGSSTDALHLQEMRHRNP